MATAWPVSLQEDIIALLTTVRNGIYAFETTPSGGKLLRCVQCRVWQDQPNHRHDSGCPSTRAKRLLYQIMYQGR